MPPVRQQPTNAPLAPDRVGSGTYNWQTGFGDNRSFSSYNDVVTVTINPVLDHDGLAWVLALGHAEFRTSTAGVGINMYMDMDGGSGTSATKTYNNQTGYHALSVSGVWQVGSGSHTVRLRAFDENQIMNWDVLNWASVNVVQL
jgi:hypothetical protein